MAINVNDTSSAAKAADIEAATVTPECVRAGSAPCVALAAAWAFVPPSVAGDDRRISMCSWADALPTAWRYKPSEKAIDGRSTGPGALIQHPIQDYAAGQEGKPC